MARVCKDTSGDAYLELDLGKRTTYIGVITFYNLDLNIYEYFIGNNILQCEGQDTIWKYVPGFMLILLRCARV